MIVIVLLTLLAALRFMDCEDIILASRTGRCTLFGYVNVFLSKGLSDYFAPDSLNNPFLHMWYLSVTIHLYIIFAAGCLVYRYIPRFLSWFLLLAIGISSFCYGYSYQLNGILQALHIPAWVQHSPVSHYSTLARVWEPMAGGLILMLPLSSSKVKATCLSLLGVAAALIPALMPTGIADYGVPLVVMGTMLIIRYMPTSSLMPLLSNKLLLWIGGISFSLYLVHMPIIAYFRIWYQAIEGWQDYAIIAGLSVVLAWLFWFLVEKRRINIYATLGLWGITMLCCILGKSTKGFRNYIYPEINNIRLTPYDDWKFCRPDVLLNQFDLSKFTYHNGVIRLLCSTIPAPSTPLTPLMQMGPESMEPRIVLIGDSHSQAAYAGLNNLCTELNIPGVCLSSIILPNWDMQHYLNSAYFYDESKAEALLKWLEANPCITHVFVGQYWQGRLNAPVFMHWDSRKEPMSMEIYSKTLRDFVLRVRALNKHVVLIGPTPEIKSSSPCKHIRTNARKGALTKNMKQLTCTREEFTAASRNVATMLDNLQKEGICSVLDTREFIPSDKPFVAYKDGKFLLTDNHHLSGEGSIEFFNFLRPQIEKILNSQTPVTSTPEMNQK